MPPKPGLAHSTLRQIIQVTIGGDRFRIHLSNEYGECALTITSVHCAISAGEHRIDWSTDTEVSFCGQPWVVIPPGEVVTSDPFEISLGALSTIAVTIAFREVPKGLTGHPGSRTTSFMQHGDLSASERMPAAIDVEHWYILAGIDVECEGAGSVVVLGDSIADGRGSTTNGNDRWPNVLARRFLRDPATVNVGVLNQGIGGNAVIQGGLGPTALERFERDVLRIAGVRWLIVACGVNDIGLDTPEVVRRLIGHYERMIQRARAARIRAFCLPILPFKGHDYYNLERERSRLTVNEWIRAPGHFDACLDVEDAVCDPNARDSLFVEYHSGDGLHLNPVGYRRIAEAIDLAHFVE
ncbi:MAG: SGNH/GDSL hydrolase family protein [Polyangiaceae bacterium]